MNEVKRLSHQVEEHEKSLSYAYQYRAEQDAEIERLRAELSRHILESPNTCERCDALISEDVALLMLQRYRDRHPCDHSVHCWAERDALAMLARDKASSRPGDLRGTS
jgi:hypothetical protein